jgi:hypothetical protein
MANVLAPVDRPAGGPPLGRDRVRVIDKDVRRDLGAIAIEDLPRMQFAPSRGREAGRGRPVSAHLEASVGVEGHRALNIADRSIGAARRNMTQAECANSYWPARQSPTGIAAPPPGCDACFSGGAVRVSLPCRRPVTHGVVAGESAFVGRWLEQVLQRNQPNAGAASVVMVRNAYVDVGGSRSDTREA